MSRALSDPQASLHFIDEQARRRQEHGSNGAIVRRNRTVRRSMSYRASRYHPSAIYLLQGAFCRRAYNSREAAARVNEKQVPNSAKGPKRRRADIVSRRGDTIMIDHRKIACLGAASFIGAVLVASVAVPAHGQSNGQRLTVVAERPDQLTAMVHYDDLSLATKNGRHMLSRRVGEAVNRVCPDSTFETYDVGDCRNFAWNGARPQIKRAIDLAGSGHDLAMTLEIVSAAK